MEINSYFIKIYEDEITLALDKNCLYSTTILYGDTIPQLPIPSKIGYTFVKWNENHNTMPDYNLYLYPIYVSNQLQFIEGENYNRLIGEVETVDKKIVHKYTITDSGRENQNYDEFKFTNLDDYITAGFKTIKIVISIDVAEKNDGYQWIFLYSDYAKCKTSQKDNYTLKCSGCGELSCNVIKLDSSGDDIQKDYVTETRTLYVNIQDIKDGELNKDSLYIVYGASGEDSDTWYNRNLEVTFTFNK